MPPATDARRCLVIGDLHARVSHLDEFAALAAATKVVAAAALPELIVLTGDLLHDHARVHTGALNAVLELVSTLAETAPLFLLIGNHDLPSSQCFLEAKHAFNAVKAWPRVEVVDQVRADAARGLVFAPFVPAGRLVEALDAGAPDWRAARAVFAHQDFRGARQGTYVSTSGDQWQADWPLVISGHFHAHQWLKRNVCYVGSPVAHDFGDEGEHTISLFTWRAAGWREERLDLGLPRRRTVEVPLDKAAAFAPAPRELVRLIVSGRTAALAAFRRSPEHQALRQRVTKLVLKATDGGTAAVARAGTYLARLAGFVAGEPPEVRRLFEELCG